MQEIASIPAYVHLSSEGVSVRRRWWTRMRQTDAAQCVGGIRGTRQLTEDRLSDPDPLRRNRVLVGTAAVIVVENGSEAWHSAS